MEQIGGGFVGAALAGVVQRRELLLVLGVDLDFLILVDEESDDVAEALASGVV